MSGYKQLFDFEQALCKFTGAPYVVATDCCTHAIELCMRYTQVGYCEVPAHTYLSVPQMLKRLGISYSFNNQSWTGEYQFENTNIWDSARRLQPMMYRAGMMQCLSFGPTKPMHLGRGGAILLDNEQAYRVISQWRSDGRDLSIAPWQDQMIFGPGYHYTPSLELCEQGLAKLEKFEGAVTLHTYPDLTKITIESH